MSISAEPWLDGSGVHERWVIPALPGLEDRPIGSRVTLPDDCPGIGVVVSPWKVRYASAREPRAFRDHRRWAIVPTRIDRRDYLGSFEIVAVFEPRRAYLRALLGRPVPRDWFTPYDRRLGATFRTVLPELEHPLTVAPDQPLEPGTVAALLFGAECRTRVASNGAVAKLSPVPYPADSDDEPAFMLGPGQLVETTDRIDMEKNTLWQWFTVLAGSRTGQSVAVRAPVSLTMVSPDEPLLKDPERLARVRAAFLRDWGSEG